MVLTDRQEEILALIRDKGQVDVDSLTLSFGVTSQTIRRDLTELSAFGLAVRTHGGAKRIAAVTGREYNDRRQFRADEKEKMGRLAASLIPDHAAVALNIGTTTEQVARALTRHDGLMVLSNNINIINTFIGTGVRELVLAGGSVRASDGAIVGEGAVEFISRYKVDFAVIGASALDEDGSVLDFDAREVSVARSILNNARTKILVCDSSKFERTAPVRICEVADLDYVVTDVTPPRDFVRAAEIGNTIILTPEQSNGDRHV
ncbi:MAG: DeoR/GlpR family DNA-binding transcription regulator [Paracoccaceae bacterium]